jgi:hypothetical protein
MKNHNFSNCYFKDYKESGFPKRYSKDKRQANLANLSEDNLQALISAVVHNLNSNKSGKQYFYDTGATPTSFVNEKPADFVPIQGKVGTAGSTSHETLGVGKIKFGELQLDATYVPSFSKNLVSGIAINNCGYHQTLGNDQLVITDGPPTINSTVMATGKLNKTVGLFQMDPVIDKSALPLLLGNRFAALSSDEIETESNKVLEPSSWMEVHRSLGHCSDGIMRKTLPHLSIPRKENCKNCLIGKATRNRIPLVGTRKRAILETISMDLQGPFRLKNSDGEDINIKFVDKGSRYIKMEWLPNKKGETIVQSLKLFTDRMERRTGLKVQSVQTDNDPCFEGALTHYLQETGITREKGETYEHHFPPDAENANRLILHRSRAIHLDSNLPAQFYTDAQDCAVYTHNRTVHYNQSKTPFELIYGYPPDMKLSKIHFGCVGYMFITKELRNKEGTLGKLEPSAKRVRCLMFGDDDSIEEIKGYKVLVEETSEIIYTKNVKWFPKEEMTPLPGFRAMNELESTDIYEADSDPSDNYIEENDEHEPDTTPIPELNAETETESESEVNFVNNLFSSYGLTAFALLALTDGIPQNYKEAMQSSESGMWKKAMKSEYQKFLSEQVYELCDVPVTVKNVMKNRWVFKKKT